MPGAGIRPLEWLVDRTFCGWLIRFMRSRRSFWIVAAVGLLAGLVLFWAETRKRAAISAEHVTYRKLLGGRLWVELELVNAGNVPVEFHVSHDVVLRVEGPENCGAINLTSTNSQSVVALPPQARVGLSLQLPAGIQRWEVGYDVREPPPPPPNRSRIVAAAENQIWRLFGRRQLSSDSKAPVRVWAGAQDAQAWLLANADAPVHMDIPFGAMFSDPVSAMK